MKETEKRRDGETGNQRTGETPSPFLRLAVSPLIRFLALCGALLFAAPLAAHEHARVPLAATAMFDAAGRLWLATVKDEHVWVSTSADNGKTFGTPAAVNPQPENIAADGENRPKIAIGPQGEIYISYTQSLDKPYTGHIRFSRSLDGGKHFSVPITVNDNRDIISHRFDSMAVNNRGDIYLAWLDKRDQQTAAQKKLPYAGAAIYYAVSSNGGERFSASKKMADHSCECCRVALATDTDGIPVAAWRHVYDNNTRDHAVARLDGNAVIQRISHDDWEVDACPHHGPSLSIGDDGIYHAAWFTQGKKRHGLFYARSADKGAHFSGPLPFGNEDAQAAHPCVLSIGQSVYLAWKEFDGQLSTIRLMHSADGGASWSAPRSIAQSGGASDHPLLIARGTQIFLSWNTLREGFRLIEVTTKLAAEAH